MKDENKNEKLTSSVNFDIEGLENFLGRIKDNVFELTAYDAKIEAFQISPDIKLADEIIKDSEHLFQTDILKIDADILNPSLGLETIKTDLFDTQSIINVNEGISSLINEPLKLSDSVDEIFAVDPSWSKNFDPLNLDLSIDEISGTVRLPDLNIEINELASNVLFSESTYLNLDNIGKNIESRFSLNANEALINFSDSFSKFGSLIALDNQISTGFSINDDLLTLSSNQLLRSSSLLDNLAIDDTFIIPHYDEKNAYLKQREVNEEDDLKIMLQEIDDGLVDMLDGAEKALGSSNPDKIRHFGTSLRELFTHVLNQLAPNEQVAKWTDDKSHFHDERPTRRAKILYISRGLNNKKFQEFLDADVKSVLSFIYLFQGITHSIKSNYTDQQLKGILIKMKGTLHFLISTHKSS